MRDPFMHDNRISFLKSDLKELANDKLVELGNYPSYITKELIDKIVDLHKYFFELKQSNTFTEDKGVEILKDIDEIYRELAQLKIEATKEHPVGRFKTKVNPKSKRKICKCKKGR